MAPNILTRSIQIDKVIGNGWSEAESGAEGCIKAIIPSNRRCPCILLPFTEFGMPIFDRATGISSWLKRRFERSERPGILALMTSSAFSRHPVYDPPYTNPPGPFLQLLALAQTQPRWAVQKLYTIYAADAVLATMCVVYFLGLWAPDGDDISFRPPLIEQVRIYSTATLPEFARMESPQGRPTSVYNGVSNRSRGWKTWKPQKAPQSMSVNPIVMKWDGVSRSSEIWDNLRRDPELWFRDGDCYVHLHAEGQSHRGASFKVPYSMLLEANFQPLIHKFLSRNRNDTAKCPDHAVKGQVELFIPAPPIADKRHSYNYHLATRNLFAFICRRSMVGEYLGTTLITLMRSLYRFRTPNVDNVQDLMSYMDEEGYLNLNSQPTYALAILHLAEAFQLRELYIDAFAHCCGMSARLFLAPEYQLLSQVTRTMIRRARREMQFRLGQASSTLKTFLNDEMCAINIELYPGAREYLGRFRTLLQEFYSSQFGQYPPPSVDTQTIIFDAGIFRTMRNDFEALYEFLLDESLNIFQTSELSAESRICILQSINSFDSRYDHKPLFNPLPLLPDITQKKSPFWRMSWLNRPAKRSQLLRAHTLAALSSSTNSDRSDVVENDLVAAYRKLEEDQITSQAKFDKSEYQGLINGRKIRWILVYAMYQTLLRATEVPSDIRDTKGVPYHLCISTADLPPWEEDQLAHTSVHTQLDRASPPSPCFSFPALEAKSDNDYSTVLNPTICNAKERAEDNMLETPSTGGGFGSPVSQLLSGARRSLSFLTRQGSERPRSEILMTSGHEDIAQGNSNTMDPADEDKELADAASPAHPLTHGLINSSASVISNSSSRYSSSEVKTSDTPNTSVTNSPLQSPIEKLESERAIVCMSCGLHDVDRDTVASSSRWAKSSRVEDCRDQNQDIRHSPSALSIGRPTSAQEHRPRGTLDSAARDIGKAKKSPNIQMPSPQAPTAWEYIQAVMEVQASNYEVQVQAGWDQFSHLRDFIEVRSEAPTAATNSRYGRASTIF
ncbi:hypothetical protein F5Y09DRAFT_346197 [Xylaria sp. FL1042]|nr:hypothetical protein F5Y09DRAFT_346197 [Xylaria sp. FL1042]